MLKVLPANDIEQNSSSIETVSSSVELDDLDQTLEEAQYALEHPEEFKSFTNAKDFIKELSRD